MSSFFGVQLFQDYVPLLTLSMLTFVVLLFKLKCLFLNIKECNDENKQHSTIITYLQHQPHCSLRTVVSHKVVFSNEIKY